MFRILIFVFFMATASQADAEVRYFVDDTSNILKTMVTDDTLTAPAGETAVTKATIEAACSCDIYLGGTWGGTTYTPPAGIVTAIDETTLIGGVQASCDSMLDTFDAALDYIHANRFAWTDDARTSAVDGIRWQIINSARVALNSTRTHARRQKYCEESASWPTGTNGDVRQYVDAWTDDQLTTQTKDWSWVDPQADSFTRYAVGGAAQGFSNATDVENAPTSATLIGRAWIRDVP